MACVCGHAIEEHEDEVGKCEGTYMEGRRTVSCDCLNYDEEIEDNDDDDDERDDD